MMMMIMALEKRKHITMQLLFAFYDTLSTAFMRTVSSLVESEKTENF